MQLVQRQGNDSISQARAAYPTLRKDMLTCVYQMCRSMSIRAHHFGNNVELNGASSPILQAAGAVGAFEARAAQDCTSQQRDLH